ncbi:hypothetical protein SDC9_128489 [bioreactor metagenome]|uniref:Uncharacterized protein n=1 Tax=bioreactor metagenome TaxID=1076179 RepID=A0A645CWC9_9ZZZZ
MYVGMRHFQSKHHHPHPVTWNHSLYSCGHFFGKNGHFAQQLIIQIKDIIGLLFRDYQSVPFCHWVNIEKSKKFIVLGYFVRWNFSRYNPAKNRCHFFRLFDFNV